VEYVDADPVPDGLEMSERTLEYTNGDRYEVRESNLQAIKQGWKDRALWNIANDCIAQCLTISWLFREGRLET
jgi:hypothetical protein